MSNMSHCRFKNTLGDLRDCRDALSEMNDYENELSQDEAKAAEAKVMRGVSPSEFKAAVVPHDVDPAALKYLKDSGITDIAALLDAAVAFSGPTSVVTGLEHLEGKTVYVLADGDMLGPYTVSGGAVSLPKSATSGYAGLGWVPYVETLDLREKLQNDNPFRPPARIYETELSLMSTGHVMLGANGEAPEDVSVRNLDGAVPPEQSTGEEPSNDARDVPMMSRLFSGVRVIEGQEGFSEHGRIVITQAYPAPLTVRAVRYEVSYGG